MAKKSKKKASKKDQVKEIAQVDDQDESDVKIEDNYNLDHLNRKDKFIIMKIVEKNDELEEENEKQGQSLQKQEKFLISKFEELKALNERYEKLSGTWIGKMKQSEQIEDWPGRTCVYRTRPVSIPDASDIGEQCWIDLFVALILVLRACGS